MILQALDETRTAVRKSALMAYEIKRKISGISEGFADRFFADLG